MQNLLNQEVSVRSLIDLAIANPYVSIPLLYVVGIFIIGIPCVQVLKRTDFFTKIGATRGNYCIQTAETLRGDYGYWLLTYPAALALVILFGCFSTFFFIGTVFNHINKTLGKLI